MKLNKTEIFVLVAVLIALALGVAYFLPFVKAPKNLPSVVSVPEKVVASIVVPPQSPLFKLDQPLMMTVSIPDSQNPDDFIVGLKSSKAIPAGLLKWLETNLRVGAKQIEVVQIDEVTHYLVVSNSFKKLDVKSLKHAEIETPVLKESEALRLKIYLDKILENLGELSEEEAVIARLLRSYEIPCVLNPQLAQQKGEENLFSVYASLPSDMVFERILNRLGVYGVLDETDFGSKQVKLFLTFQDDGDLINPVIGLPREFREMIDLSLEYLTAEMEEEDEAQFKFWDSTVKNNFYLLGLNTKNLRQVPDDIPPNEIALYTRLDPSSFFSKLNSTINKLSDKLPPDIILAAQQSFGLLNLAYTQVAENNPYVPKNLPFFFSFNLGSLSATCEMGTR